MANGKSYERDMRPDERKQLEGLAKRSIWSDFDYRELGDTFFHIGSMLSLAAVIAWLVLAWVVRKLTGFDFGWNSPYGMVIVWSLIGLCFLYAVLLITRGGRPPSVERVQIAADLRAGKVRVENLEFSDIKGFEEPEHGGFLYFLKTTDDRVFASFDYESQTLSIQDEDPLQSSDRPRRLLEIVTAPKSGQCLDFRFSGDLLDCKQWFVLTADLDRWPEFESFVSVDWHDLDWKLQD